MVFGNWKEKRKQKELEKQLRNRQEYDREKIFKLKCEFCQNKWDQSKIYIWQNMGASCPNCDAVRFDFSRYNFYEITEMNQNTLSLFTPTPENIIRHRLFLMKCLRCNSLIDIQSSERTLEQIVSCIHCGQNYGPQVSILQQAFTEQPSQKQSYRDPDEDTNAIAYTSRFAGMDEEQDIINEMQLQEEIPICQSCENKMSVVRIKKNPNHWNITCQCGKCQTVLVIEKKF